MQYKGFEITITEALSGYGYIADDGDGAVIEVPQEHHREAYRTPQEAERQAKIAVTKFLNAYEYEGE